MKWFFALVLVLSSGLLRADKFDNEYEEKAWAEIAVQLPAFPKEADLLEFKVGSVVNTRFFIDAESISVGSDDVIRYTLIVVSSGGARNISYEGMRCATGERRFYVFGHPDNGWSKAKGSRWSRVSGGTNNHHVELYANYFCTVGAPVVSTEAIRFGLRNGGLVAKQR